LLNYYLGQALEAGNFYSEAVSAYSQVKTDSPVYQKARERISALTTAIPQPNLTEKARPATEIQPEQTIKPAQRPQTVQPIQNNQPAQNTQTQPSNRLSQTAPTTQTSPRQQITETTISTVAPLLEAAEKAYRKNDWTLAREYYEKVLAVDPRNVHALTQIGRIYFAFENQYEKAQNYLLQALQLNPDSVWLNLAVGIIEKAFNRPDSALRYFQRALILDPTHLNANFNLALIYEERNQIEKAKDHYMAVIINHPGHQLAYNYLGDIYFNEGDYFKAQDMYREILNTSPANIGIRLKLAICLEKVNDLNGSLREYEKLQPLVAGQDFVEQEVSSSIERLKRQIR
jgi:tetratricopeptide (TPR) repeat protein